jgi:hypothetical protein
MSPVQTRSTRQLLCSKRHVLFSHCNVIRYRTEDTVGETWTTEGTQRHDIGLRHFCKADGEGHRWFRDARESGVALTPGHCG